MACTADIKLASKLITQFGLHQVKMTKAANTNKGVSFTMLKQERRLIENLLEAMGIEPTAQEVQDIVNSLS